MTRFAYQSPSLGAWPTRLSRVPRWGWTLIAIAVLVPVVALLAGIVAIGLVFGSVMIAIVALLLIVRAMWLRLRTRFRDDGRRNVRIAVRRTPMG